MCTNLRKAIDKVISIIAQTGGVRRITLGNGMVVEAQDSDKLLEKLEGMYRFYENRSEGRQGARMIP